MAEYNFQGNSYVKNLIHGLYEMDNEVVRIDIIVSFLKTSGYELLEPLLKKALEEDIEIRVLTSTYMNVTDPVALQLLYSLLGKDCIRLYNGEAPSFHPKAYFFHSKKEENSKVFIGSSNISKPAFTNGIEWNYCIQKKDDEEAFDKFVREFNFLYTYESIALDKDIILDYRNTYQLPLEDRVKSNINSHFNKYKKKKAPNTADIAIAGETALEYGHDIEYLYKPNPSQLEALIELKETRENGNDRGIVVVATGVGKTFLVAFDSLEYDSVLFVAHREEILEQAYSTFSKVRETTDFGRYYGNYKDDDARVLFASVQTLMRQEHLLKFKRDAFKYIIIDEFHHASAKSYKKILDYFRGDFLVGLTATPHRLDQKNIFEICDYNLVYEVDLFMAINRGWLVPFRYYGIYDYTVDYNNIRYIHGKYSEEELEKAVSIEDRAELIYKHYSKYQSQRALGFCTSIQHAEYMASYFSKKGIKTGAIHSGTKEAHCINRKEGLKDLAEGKIQILFSVDMLNEGVDIPKLDLILFLRPTQSPVVFLQQLGRGLRKAEGKNEVKILDFIGNYKKVDIIPFLLSKEVSKDKNIGDRLEQALNDYNLPLGCTVDFEFQVVDIFREMVRAKIKVADRIKNFYYQCKEELQSVPTRMEFFQFLDEEAYSLIKQQTKFNPFRNYLGFLRQEGEIEKIAEQFIMSKAYDFIQMIETTKMSQLYKIPIFLAFYNHGSFRMKIEKEEIVDEFIGFYKNERNKNDLLRNKYTKEYRNISREDYWKLAKENPMHFLSKTHGDIFGMDANGLWIKLGIDEWIKDCFFLEQVKDAINFRRSEFIDQRLEK